MTITDEQFKSILKHEGRYADLKGDAGGETYCGIARNFQGDWEGWEILRGLVDQGYDLDSDATFNVMEPYVRSFYDKYASELAIEIRHPAMFSGILDSGITGGKGASVYVQQAICDFVGLDPKGVDGLVGPGFRNAVYEFNQHYTEESTSYTEARLMVFHAQVRRYLHVADNKAANAKSDELRAAYFNHLRSWLRRSIEIAEG